MSYKKEVRIEGVNPSTGRIKIRVSGEEPNSGASQEQLDEINEKIESKVATINNTAPDEHGNINIATMTEGEKQKLDAAVQTVEGSADKLSALEQKLEGISGSIFGEPLDEYELYTIVTDSGDVVDPDIPNTPDDGGETEPDNPSGGEEQDGNYANFDNLVFWVDAIKQLENPEFKNNTTKLVDFTGNVSGFGEAACYMSNSNSDKFLDITKVSLNIKDESFIASLDNGFTAEFVFQDYGRDYQGVLGSPDRGSMALIHFSGAQKMLYFNSLYKGQGTADEQTTSIKHITLTHSSGGEVKVYVDGVLSYTGTDEFTPSTEWANGMYMLGYSAWNWAVVALRLNSIRIYKSVLTDSMIRYNKSVDDARFGNVNIEQ